MADIIESIFQRKKVCPSKLEPYGFCREGENFSFRHTLKESGFELEIQITPQGEILTQIVDPATGEPYTLHLTDRAAGGFVGSVRTEYEEILTNLMEKCFEPEIFKFQQAKQLIEYVRSTYGDELEFLWQKFPDNAVWRRRDNEKWYGAILTVSRRKLGLNSDEIVEIIDLRYPPEDLEELIDGKVYFSGWHMNKKHWYTIILDGSVSLEDICRKIDKSYLLAKNQHPRGV